MANGNRKKKGERQGSVLAKKKYDMVTELYMEAAKEVSAKPENWMAFLRSACRNYRLPFDEQLLIHVQRPNAAAVLQMEDWNKKFGRWVKRDAKGIAVIDQKPNAMRLKYYFDISDTQEGKHKRLVRPVPLWEVNAGQREAVRETLADAFGVKAKGAKFAETILEAAGNAAEDNFPDYLDDILTSREGSFLEGLDADRIEAETKELMKNSIAYMLLVRCGVDPDAYLSADDFRNIGNFNTLALVNLFGAATSGVSEIALREVADTVGRLSQEEKKKSRTFAGMEADRYNKKEQTETNTEGSLEYERDSIQQARRISPARHHRARRTGTTPWEVRIPAPELPEGASLRDIYHPADQRKTEPAPERDTGRSTESDGTAHRTDGTSAGCDGGTESERPDGMGRQDGEHPSGGRGTNYGGTDLQLTSQELETEANNDWQTQRTPMVQLMSKELEPEAGNDRQAEPEPQLKWHDRSSEDRSLPFFGEDKDIKSLLLSTPHLKAEKKEIQAFLESHEDKEERTAYIKSIFNHEYTELTLEDGRRVGYKAYQNVLHMWEGSYLSRTSQAYYDWGILAGYFDGMRLLGELRDKCSPLLTVEGQFSIMEELAEEKPSAFSFSQEIIDTVIQSGSNIQHGKYSVYSYFIKNHTRKQKAEFLKKSYGFSGKFPVILGTDIDMMASGKGLKLICGETELTLSWEKVAKRIEELMEAGRYLTKREMEYFPEYEKNFLAAEIFHFYDKQPEEVMRPYPYGADYQTAVAAIQPQLEEAGQVKEILAGMEEVIGNTKKPDPSYNYMRHIYQDISDYQNDAFPLLTFASNEIQEGQKAAGNSQQDRDALALPGQPALLGREETLVGKLNEFYQAYAPYEYQINVEEGQTQEEVLAELEGQLFHPQSVREIYSYLSDIFEEMETGDELYPGLKELIERIGNLPSMHPPYNLQVDTAVFIGAKEYRIEFLSDETAVLRDIEYPLFTEEMSRGELERKVRENPANDHLQEKQPLQEKTARNEIAGHQALPEPQEKKKSHKGRLAIAEKNYWSVMELAPEVMSGEQESKRFTAGKSFMPLTIERIGERRIAVSHYYSHNGDVIADPDMEFEYDHETKTLNARTYQQDNLHIFQSVMSNGAHNIKLEEELNQFAGQWFDNIRQQGYESVQEIEAKEEALVKDNTLNQKEKGAGQDQEEQSKSKVQGQGEEPKREGELEEYQKKEIGQDPENTKQQDNSEENALSESGFIPTWEQKKPAGRSESFDLHPEIPKEQRSQYRILDDALGYGTQKEKFHSNLAAIQLLKKCEEEGRYATPDEQETLAKYVGWGGLSDAFDETKPSWGYEYLELKTVLTEAEYSAARESTLTTFYTPPVVIRAIYQALENMGLKTGNILEPSCGVGNFIGMKPESLSGCSVYGVELDPISGRIAKQLYQKSAIAVQGYEEAKLPDNFFDVAVGNVPFGQFKISDKRYDKHHFLVHDFFFAKTLDKVRPGGVIAFITSSGTMDKKNPSVRRYIAQRAELLGAIRLPNNTFLKNAGTQVTADILFLQKRDRMVEAEPDWIYLNTDENGITQNHYFIEHPEMALGEMALEHTQYGMDSVCRPHPGKELKDLLEEAIVHIHAEISEYETGELVEETANAIPADPNVANYSFTVSDGNIYYRENSRMKLVELSKTGANRVKGMVEIRDCVRELIAFQRDGYPDADIQKGQRELNRLYDVFRSKYGLLNARANHLVFADDSSYPLLCSLEVLAEDGTLERKADMFTKRTIKAHEAVTKVETASEALSLSLSEKACVDMEYMCQLTGKGAEEVEQELKGVIFRLPDIKDVEPQFVSEDEYLSGNVRKKLKEAKLAAQSDPVYETNVQALERVQPKDLSAAEISVRLGATWIPTEDVGNFMFELLETPGYLREHFKIYYSKSTGEWRGGGKSGDKGKVKANNTYGTHRANAYKILEDTLNLRDTRIYDYEVDDAGKKKAVLNKKETAIAQGKQDLIKQAFQDWIWQEPERRQRLASYYNEHFNAIRPREYDGSHLHFYGMNPEIQLRQHQKNGIARILYGGNTLLAHVMGAGKTYTMVAAAMESRRLGLCSKSMVVVPNHIIEQFAAEWLQLYPAVNILVATKRDFETKNRKKFCARIATSDIDAVIIGHSQFERIPLSVERQQWMLHKQLEEVMDGILEAKCHGGSRFTVKQLEKSKKSLEGRLKKLNDQSRKDDVVCFEELGIDRLFVDEADSYKNLFLYTKMRNVAGIAQTEAQKSSDMFLKCRYLDELTGGKGVIFATGTPISNSITELYTMQRYLQYGALEESHLQHFDAWASTFGETVSAIELAPEGSGYRMKTRFAKFYNLPELMVMFREVADIQTADMLNLPVPEAEYRVIHVKPSEMQKEMVEELGNRAERVRNGMVDPASDNMLLITNDGRKLALDQRLANEMLPDEPGSKINVCVEEVYKFWEEGREKKLTQLLFCDLSTPKNDGTFSVYNDIRDKLVAKGIPPEEIAFIHHADTDTKKKELFSKVRRGAVRVLMGSTFKMGAGMNVQDLIVASHDLDVPWRPRDLQQRLGRTVRQGNTNKKVAIIRYVTEGTFDAFLYQVIENKQKFISQIMTSKSPVRSMEDIDEAALSYAEIKALATGNVHIKEKMELDIQVSKLQLLKQSFLSQKYEMENKVARYFPKEIKEQKQRITGYEADMAQVQAHTPSERSIFPPMQINGRTYQEKKEAGQALLDACKAMKSPEGVPLGAYRGFQMELSYESFSREFVVALKGKRTYHVTLGKDLYGNITRIDHEIEKIPDSLEQCRERLKTLYVQLETAKEEAKKEFPREQELSEKVARLGELNALLDLDKKDKILLDEVVEGKEAEPKRKKTERER